MELYLQFGYGMMEHCRHLVDSWGVGTVIMSPRDLTTEQIQRFGSQVASMGGRILVDPQFYDPRATHPRLIRHDYWPDDFDTSMLSGGPKLAHLLQRLLALNNAAQADRFIIPGIYGERVDDDWLAVQDSVITEAATVVADRPRIATVCLSGEAMRFEDQIEMVINSAEIWDVDGLYVVPEHPGAQYLVDDPMWLANLLVLCSGLKLQGKSVIVGYSSHQMLCLAASKVDAIASGIWLNVRSFSTSKFQETEEDEISRRVKWYYCPQALSEYKIPFLDMAFRAGILNHLRADAAMESDYAGILFSGAQPTSTAYSEQQAHRHYLQCLYRQCREVSRTSFRETAEWHSRLLDNAEALINELHRRGVRGQDRDFQNIIDVNRAALTALQDARGFILERLW
ncbi:MAG: hypothetical protein KG012_07645 [Deltaproteobacteria bacterium]|nr:hypothetical protein [Deltaproteobacteria bacterium]